MSDQSEVIKKYLSSHNIGEVVTSSPHKAMITIQASDTVETALEVFRKFNILSAPVLKADEDKKEGETPFLGIVNILDLLIAAIFQPLFDKLDTEEKISEAKEDELESLLDSKETAFQKPVKEVLGKSDESKTLPIFDAKDSLTKLMEAFSAGVHRVIVKSIGEDEKDSYSYISQTDVVRSLRKVALDSGAKVGGILTNTIAELKLNAKSVKVLTIPSTTRALIGFRSMLSQGKQVSAVPVTDASSGALVETLSASDFRGVRHDSLRLLLLSVTEFLKLSRAKPRQAISTHKNLVCGGSEVFGDVIQRIVSSGVHRLWIVNDDEAPTGVISLTDVIRQFTSHAAVPTTAAESTPTATTTTTTATATATATTASPSAATDAGAS